MISDYRGNIMLTYIEWMLNKISAGCSVELVASVPGLLC